MNLTNILDVVDVIYEYGSLITIDDIISDTNLSIDIVREVLSLLIEYDIIEELNNKYQAKLEYSYAYDTIIQKYK